MKIVNSVYLCFLFACLAVFSTVSVLQAEELPNGCGPVGASAVIPDKVIFTTCSFTRACNLHDKCYSRCLQGGDLYGLPTCNDKVAKDIRRKQCDLSFYADMISFNHDSKVCNFFASVYYSAVDLGGDRYFFGYRGPAEFIKDLQITEANVEVIAPKVTQFIQKRAALASIDPSEDLAGPNAALAVQALEAQQQAVKELMDSF